MNSILEIKSFRRLPICCSEIVQNPENIPNFEFYNSTSIGGEGIVMEVTTKNIKGTTHCSYHNISWIEMLAHLPRQRYDVDEDSVKMAIADDKASERKSVAKYGEDYYILSGNHRLCQAKMLEIETVICYVYEYNLNQKALDVYHTFHALGGKCTYRQGYFYDIDINNVNIRDLITDDMDNLCKMYASIKTSFWKQSVYYLQYLIDKFWFNSVCDYWCLAFDNSNSFKTKLEKALLLKNL